MASDFVYVLGTCDCGQPRTYVGWTTNLEARLEAHNEGKGAKSTRGRIWTLLYAEPFKTRGEALSREYHLKKDRALRKTLMDNAGLS